jgi:hypothetical protein
MLHSDLQAEVCDAREDAMKITAGIKTINFMVPQFLNKCIIKITSVSYF